MLMKEVMQAIADCEELYVIPNTLANDQSNFAHYPGNRVFSRIIKGTPKSFSIQKGTSNKQGRTIVLTDATFVKKT